MPHFFRGFLAALLGTALGLYITYFAVEHNFGFGAVHAGAWIGMPKSGSDDADPYTRANLSRTGEIPLGLAEGLTFIARADGGGRPLDPRCDYRISGAVPAARYWTISLITPDGQIIANEADRHGFTSAELERSSDGAFQIVVSRSARTGNWLPAAGRAPFALMLRIYDTPVSAIATTLNAAAMPDITRGPCQ